MKKIINNRRYDTEAAEIMGEAWYSSPGDFHYWEERLFRKRNGEFFLHGSGGPLSKYAVSVGQGSWEGGEKIIPLTVEKAKEWAEENLDGDKYEAIFGPVEDSEDKIGQYLHLPSSTVEKLKRKAGERGMNLSDLATEILEGAL